MLMHVCAIHVSVLQRHEILGESIAKLCLIGELVNTLPSQAKKGDFNSVQIDNGNDSGCQI